MYYRQTCKTLQLDTSQTFAHWFCYGVDLKSVYDGTRGTDIVLKVTNIENVSELV